SYRLQDVVHRHASHQQFRRVGDDVELRFLTALDQHSRNTVQAVQARLDFVRDHFPQLGLVQVVGTKDVAHDRETGKGQAVGSDFRGGRKFTLYARYRRIHILQRLEHVNVPIEKQIDFSRSTACNRAHILKTGHAI